MYSFRPSWAANRCWTATNWRRGSRWKQTKNSPASCWPSAIDAVVERVAPAQQVDPAVGGRGRLADVRADRDHGLAGVVERVEVHGVELVLRTERCAAVLEPADGPLLLVERRAVPRPRAGCGCGARPGRSRRASTREPPDPTHTCSRIVASSLVWMLLVPSLYPIRLRGVSWCREVDDVRPNPTCDPPERRDAASPADQVVHGVERDERIVCAGLDHQVTAAAGRVELVAGEGGQRRPACGRAQAARPYRSSPPAEKSPGAEPEGQRQPGRSRPDRLTGVDRRGHEVVVEGGHRTTGRELDRSRGPAPQQLGHVLAPVGHQVEGGQVEVVLGRRGDPGLVRTVEGHHVRSRVRRRTGVRRGRGLDRRVPATPIASPKPPAPARKARRSSPPALVVAAHEPTGGARALAPASRCRPRRRPPMASRRSRPGATVAVAGNPDGVRRPGERSLDAPPAGTRRWPPARRHGAATVRPATPGRPRSRRRRPATRASPSWSTGAADRPDRRPSGRRARRRHPRPSRRRRGASSRSGRARASTSATSAAPPPHGARSCVPTTDLPRGGAGRCRRPTDPDRSRHRGRPPQAAGRCRSCRPRPSPDCRLRRAVRYGVRAAVRSPDVDVVAQRDRRRPQLGDLVAQVGAVGGGRRRAGRAPDRAGRGAGQTRPPARHLRRRCPRRRPCGTPRPPGGAPTTRTRRSRFRRPDRRRGQPDSTVNEPSVRAAVDDDEPGEARGGAQLGSARTRPGVSVTLDRRRRRGRRSGAEAKGLVGAAARDQQAGAHRDDRRSSTPWWATERTRRSSPSGVGGVYLALIGVSGR